MESTEAEGIDNDWSKGGDRCVGNHGKEGREEYQPEFQIQQQLDDLAHLEVGVAYTGVIGS